MKRTDHTSSAPTTSSAQAENDPPVWAQPATVELCQQDYRDAAEYRRGTDHYSVTLAR